MGQMRNVYRIFIGKPEGKRSRGRPKRRWENNIRVDLRGTNVGRCGLDACGTAYGPVAVSCVHGNESSVSIKGGEGLD
jgi:hypothetical protein